jgi:hypothetical protein
MLHTYLSLTLQYPFLTAFAQFAILGTAGEILAAFLRDRTTPFPLLSRRGILKVLGWGCLGAYIKVMFLTAASGIQTLFGEGWARQAVLTQAFATSVLMNVMLGPSMILLHRISDNAIDRVSGVRPRGWDGIPGAIGTLAWLWIPLHTFTFMQPREARIGIAAALSLVLGIALGWFARKR